MNADQCVHCGLCLSACPTYQVTGLEVESPRGRLVLLKDWESDPAGQNLDAARWLDDCLDCRACELACPAAIPTGHLVEEWRSRAALPTNNRRVMGALSRLVASRRGIAWLQKLGRARHSAAARLAMRSLGPTLADVTDELSAGLPHHIPSGLSRDRIAPDPGAHDAMLFVGCIMDAWYPQSNEHTADLLRLSGVSCAVPRNQVCCGALHLHGGQPDVARRLAEVNIGAFEASGASRLVVNAAGCGTTLKEYPVLFNDDLLWTERAVRFSHAVVDALEVLEQAPLPVLEPHGDSVTVHDACHHTAQHITAAPRKLLERAGYTIVEMSDSTRCCGSAGVYNLTHAEMSRELAARKVADIPAAVDTVAAANPGCIMQIQAALNRPRPAAKVVHPIDLAYTAYERAGLTPRRVP